MKDVKYFIILYVLLVLAVIPTLAHHGYLIIDCGREAYYPAQILAGKVLYRDIFNIYGPFSYMFNAVLFKIFGINLNVLYLSGCICAFAIVNLTYLIARRFFNEFLSCSIAVLTIITGVLNLNLFNFIFPYSYGMLYGTVAVLVSIWLLLKYENEPEKVLYLYSSGFFAGLCVANKYEFLPYFLVIFYAAFKIKSLNLKQWSTLLFSLIFIPILFFGVLFLQGLRLQDLISAGQVMNKMAHSQTLKYFYLHKGVFFHKQTIWFLLKNFFGVLFPILFLFYSAKSKNKILWIICTVFLAGLILYSFKETSFVFLPVLISILFIFNFKNIKNNPKFMILTLSSILLTLKIYWGLVILNYGNYFLSLSLIAVIALILDKSKDKKIWQLIFAFYIILASVSLCLFVYPDIKLENNYISTSRGKFYLEDYYSKSTQKLIKYIKTNTKSTDTVVILPEGLLINYLTERKSDDYYNSLIPLYVETFGEDKIIEHFKKTKPEYIIFNNWNMKDYYFQYICEDYALSFCSFVAQNYKQEKVIDEGFRYLIFKIKR